MNDLTRAPRAVTEERIDENAPVPGRWYWVREADDEGRWLGCVTRLGSNFAELTSAGGRTSRVHFNEFNDICHAEPEAAAYIEKQIQGHHRETRKLMGEVQEVTERLALGPSTLGAGNETQALALRGNSQPAEEYKAALVLAKEKTLPALFEQIKKSNEAMATWSRAQILPLQAQVTPMKTMISAIENRLFNVELYAGLTESAAKIQDGKPASLTEPIHLFQRRHYMDEECLANYEAGGMRFASIKEFDRWLLRPENLERILPFPRCIVAFQVRRKAAHEEPTSWREMIALLFDDSAKADKKTFLYIRNGEQVSWLETEIDFGAQLFPDQDHSNLSGKLYANANGSRPDKVITENEWLAMQIFEDKEEATYAKEYARKLAEYKKEAAAYPALLKAFKAAEKKYEADDKAWHKAREEWEKKAWTEVPYDAAGRTDIERIRNKDVPAFELKRPERPHGEPHEPFPPWESHSSRKSQDFTPFTKDNIYFDEIAAKVKADLDAHNRLVLVLQGLLDRSAVLHPHPAWRLWEQESFASALRLVYDESRALVPGPKPDFAAYRARLNARIGEGTVTIGQDRFWQEIEAEKLNARREHDENHFHRERYRPRDDPGPGKLAKVVRVRGDKATFEWTVTKTKERWERSASYKIPGRQGTWTHKNRVEDKRLVTKRLVVPLERLFNVSAYQPGDFKQFFQDPRSRADYLSWAWLLLEAEEFKAGNRKVAPGIEGDLYPAIAETPVKPKDEDPPEDEP